MIWNESVECMDREQLREIQSRRLVKMAEYVYHNTPFYRKKFQEMGLEPGDIKGIDDIVKLPFTNKLDLRDNYPFGLAAVPMSQIVRIHASSGTTGKPAFRHVRAYRTDVQAVCDSLVYNSQDSCMTMYYDPIVWNDNQQLVGDRIEVFLRDSVIDRAHIIGNCFSIQQLRTDTTCYNQVSSKEMFAFFVDGNIHEARAKDNVLIGYYFEEGDSIPIIYNYQETTELRMFLKDRKIQRVWTPKTSGHAGHSWYS